MDATAGKAPGDRSPVRAADGGAGSSVLAQRLAAALRAQAEVHGHGEQLARELSAAVIQRQAALVARVTAAQQDHLEAVARADAATLAAAALLAQALGLPPQAPLPAVAQGLAARGGDAAAAGVREGAAGLAAAAGRERAANRRNALLLRDALAFTGFALRTLTAAGLWGYTDTGVRRPVAPRARLDAQA